MKLEVFSVYDSAVGAFMQPFFMRSKGEAIRSFTDACNGDGKPFVKNPADYTLFILGSFDDGSGAFDTAPPERVITALECISKD